MGLVQKNRQGPQRSPLGRSLAVEFSWNMRICRHRCGGNSRSIPHARGCRSRYGASLITDLAVFPAIPPRLLLDVAPLDLRVAEAHLEVRRDVRVVHRVEHVRENELDVGDATLG